MTGGYGGASHRFGISHVSQDPLYTDPLAVLDGGTGFLKVGYAAQVIRICSQSQNLSGV